MFRRCVAKSVEALSRIAIKRACKFALKKKLGHFILGDIDLHQLDVQLAAGLILLSDLAINADLLNSKLSQTSIIRVKEGSIGSLSVKLPWSAGGYEVEVDELELVLYPFCGDELGGVVETHDSGVCYSTFHDDCGKGEADDVCTSSAAAAASVSVHQGVKTVAKWVQQLLTRFHVRVKNVIVAFDACVDNDGKTDGSHEALVLRVAEIECGTCISENDDVSADRAKAADLLGMTHLTNFLKFQGVVLDLVRMSGDVDKQLSGSAEVSASCSSKASQPLITGHKGGFGGSIKLSIPCKDGSLDIRKVDADVKVDSLIAKLQPSTLKWVLTTWDTLQKLDNKLVGSVYHMAADTHLSSSIPLDKKTTETENPDNFGNPFKEKTATGALLKESQFISDWIPDSSSEEGFEEADLGASVDQFFECLDGMRSSHSVLGSSGVWGWTSSYFSAITAASNLASGSLNMSVEQQLLETNLKITFVGVSAFYSFLDEDQLTQLGPTGERLDADPNVHHLGSIWEDIVVAVQVFPRTWRLEATVDHIVLNEYMCQCGDSVDLALHDHVNDHNSQTLVIRDLQKRVQKALPYNPFFGEPSNVGDSGASANLKAPSSLCCPANRERSSDIVTVTLFETSGASHCLFSASSGSSDGSSTGQASLSLKLPPFVFWLSSDLVNMALDFLRNFDDFSRESRATINVSSEALKEQAAVQSSVSCSSNLHSTSIPRKGALVGNVLLPHGRIFLCFPLNKDRSLRSFSSWNEFIALDFSSPSNLMELKPEVPAFVRENTHGKQDSSSPSHSMHLNVANLSLYHVIGLEGDSCNVEQGSHKLSAHKVLSLGSRTDWSRLISVVRRENAVTGAWIKKSAKLFATSDGPTCKTSSSDYEFASVSSWEHKDNLSSLKEKLVLSSKLCLHVCVPSTVVILSNSRYLCLVDLVKQAINAFASVGNDTDHENKKKAISQTSILVECGLVEIHLELSQGSCLKSSLQRELPGSWHSLRLEVRNLEVLCVSDLGAVSGAHFLWISHCEGKLWGSVSMGADQDFMLISFDNSSNGRGDGEGSNVLSFRPAGSKFVLMSDPNSSHDFMSVVLKCGTIIAPGGRLDWLDKLSSFFSLPPPDVELNTDCKLEKGDSKGVVFVIKLLDAALSYEPYFKKSEVNEERVHSRSHVSVSSEDKSHDPHVACLLAASSLMLSNTDLADGLDNDYRIRLQDVGLLLHEVSRVELILDEYSAGYLREVGYVKVAEEALISAILKVNYEDDISWELWCSEMNIVLRTCHDTTFGLIRLASQIQQLFAPDIKESLVHLQNRWNVFQEAQGRDDLKGSSESSISSSPGRSQSQHVVPDSNEISELAGLMGEICEDAFLLRETNVGTPGGSQLNKDLNDAGPSSSNARPESFLELGHTKGEIMEEYCLSDLKSLSELTINSHFGEEISKLNLVRSGSLNLQEGNSGWYGRPPLRIVENYVADKAERTCLKQLIECQQYDKENNCSRLYKGRVLLKNAKIKWQMYAGSDWLELGQSRKICGRDGSVYLELVFINMDIQYDIFPDGDLCASKLSVSVQDLHLSDQSKNAPWRLVLGYYNSKEHPRESLSKAFKLDLEAVRPDPMTPLEEYRLRIAILPILLHLHQSQLDFLVAFFGNKRSPVEQQSDTENSGLSDVSSGGDNKFNDDGIAEEALLPFFQKFDISPIVARVDYYPSRVDLAALSSGKYVELVNLVPWKGVELQLKHVQAPGVYGWSNVFEIAIGEWLEDISQNQIHKLLKGLPTIRSFVAVGSGAAKLLSLPVKNYKKDYKLVKGLQRGTISFLKSISIEALGLGVHLVAGAHEVLLHAEYILTRMQPSVSRPMRSKLKLSLGSEQPQNAQHGLQQACERLSSGLGKSASAVIHSPLKTYRRDGSAGSALVTAFKGAPAAAIAPASAAAQALHSALVGVRNSLDPEHKEESMNKYLGPHHSSKR
ncbi:hypothetical protein RND81_11G064700 [Saponaria officinalis]|uniref:Autophagy-related protein 2 n=3 Tax=Saponaria officinalis TaxID=3572 RepID=A0AAW1HIS0_SAPOF